MKREELNTDHWAELDEAEKIRRELERNEPNQLTNNTGTVDIAPSEKMDFDYYDDRQDDFDIG